MLPPHQSIKATTHASGYLIFDSTWKPVTWQEQNLNKEMIWFGSPLPVEYFFYGTPQVDTQVAVTEHKQEEETVKELR